MAEILDEMTMVAEGVKTSSSVRALSEKQSVEMPICDAVYESLYEGLDPKEAVNRLMTRELGSEENCCTMGKYLFLISVHLTATVYVISHRFCPRSSVG